MAKKYGMDVVEFGMYAEAHPEIDRKLDAAMVRRAKKEEMILQGRLAGWMAVQHNLSAIKIWIGASPRVRAERVAKRQGEPFGAAAAEIKKRDQDNRIRYLQTYGLDLQDLSIYDITVQTDGRSVEWVVSSLVKTLSLWPKKHKIPRKPSPQPKRPPLRKRRSKSRK